MTTDRSSRPSLQAGNRARTPCGQEGSELCEQAGRPTRGIRRGGGVSSATRQAITCPGRASVHLHLSVSGRSSLLSIGCFGFICRSRILVAGSRWRQPTSSSPAAKRKGRPNGSDGPQRSARRCPTLPGVCTPSTIGAGGLNFRVRNGNGWIPAAIATGRHQLFSPPPGTGEGVLLEHSIASMKTPELRISSPRTISTGPLNTLLRLHFRPINLVFYQGPYPVSRWEISSRGGLRT